MPQSGDDAVEARVWPVGAGTMDNTGFRSWNGPPRKGVRLITN